MVRQTPSSESKKTRKVIRLHQVITVRSVKWTSMFNGWIELDDCSGFVPIQGVRNSTPLWTPLPSEHSNAPPPYSASGS